LTGIHGELSFIPALLKQLRLQGVLVGNRSQQQDMIRAIEANDLRPVLDRTYPLEEMVEAFKHLESQSHVGKIVLAIS
ncbi:MAG: NAD(P)-dependent alcohol dehydrogenase, partial [Gammaproteobacteria bacterium]|nr:NAD(P)-dependent alcohol dehydrogenase [Gammaproteobacteria bacterium]NDE56222.1 NAD(P)-dependent alcohol dehydrogenase [Gammaproteobacteria bacterium]